MAGLTVERIIDKQNELMAKRDAELVSYRKDGLDHHLNIIDALDNAFWDYEADLQRAARVAEV